MEMLFAFHALLLADKNNKKPLPYEWLPFTNHLLYARTFARHSVCTGLMITAAWMERDFPPELQSSAAPWNRLWFKPRKAPPTTNGRLWSPLAGELMSPRKFKIFLNSFVLYSNNITQMSQIIEEWRSYTLIITFLPQRHFALILLLLFCSFPSIKS